MKIEWRLVVGYEDLYEVSNSGKLRSIGRSFSVDRSRNHINQHYTYHRKSKILKPYTVTKSGVKYHLHRRVRRGCKGQTDKYVYIDTLMQQSFPELYSEDI